MRIVYVITGLLYGGAEIQLLELASRMRDRGHKVLVVSVLPLTGLSDEIKRRGVAVETLDIRGRRLDPRAALRLARVIRSFRPEVVHSLMVHSNLLTRVTRLIARQPVLINTALGFSEGRSSTESPRARELAYRLTDWLSDATTQVSQACAERYVDVRAVPKHKISVIPSGVDTTKFNIFDATAEARLEFGPDIGFRWLTVGRLVDVKDQVTAVRAFAHIVDDSPLSEFVLRGNGPKEKEIGRVAQDLGVASRVRILPDRCDISWLMNGADAFVLSSVSEGMPTAALEAAACGLPIVATDVGGNREVVADGISGYVVPPSNPRALAEAMRKVMTMADDNRRRMGLEGRKLVQQKYDFEIVANQYEELYDELLAAKGLGPER